MGWGHWRRVAGQPLLAGSSPEVGQQVSSPTRCVLFQHMDCRCHPEARSSSPTFPAHPCFFPWLASLTVRDRGGQLAGTEEGAPKSIAAVPRTCPPSTGGPSELGGQGISEPWAVLSLPHTPHTNLCPPFCAASPVWACGGCQLPGSPHLLLPQLSQASGCLLTLWWGGALGRPTWMSLSVPSERKVLILSLST